MIILYGYVTLLLRYAILLRRCVILPQKYVILFCRYVIPQLKLNIEVAKTLGRSVLQGENSAKILGQTVLQGENSEEIKPRRSPNGYLLSDPLPQGLVLKDLRKKTWKLGKSIGLGGFGEIYAAALLDGEKTCLK